MTVCSNCQRDDAEFRITMYKAGSVAIGGQIYVCEPCKDAWEWGEARAKDGALSLIEEIEHDRLD